jgi:hypothetical protein
MIRMQQAVESYPKDVYIKCISWWDFTTSSCRCFLLSCNFFNTFHIEILHVFSIAYFFFIYLFLFFYFDNPFTPLKWNQDEGFKTFKFFYTIIVQGRSTGIAITEIAINITTQQPWKRCFTPRNLYQSRNVCFAFDVTKNPAALHRYGTFWVILNLVLFCLIVLTKVWGAQMASKLTDVLLKLLCRNYWNNMCVTCVCYMGSI